MRHVALAFVIFTLGCGDEGPTDMGVDMSMPDLTVQDLTTPPDFAGISCGNMTCDTATQECCVMVSGGMFNPMCTGKHTCNTDAGNAVLECDGPEDCPGLSSSANAGCCISLSGQLGSADAGTMTMGTGSSSCTNSCPGSATYDGQNFTANTKLCNVKADCANYLGSFLGSPTSFTSCCTSTMTGSFHFCFNGGFAAMSGGAVTCSTN